MFGNAVTPVWPLFLVCSVIWGLGSGAIDAGLNAYVASHFSSRHVNWLHACYSLGATAGPFIMTVVLLRAGSWRLGYALVGGIIISLATMFLVTRKRWGSSDSTTVGPHSGTVSIRQTLQSPLVQLQVLIFFLYTGLEFAIGQWTFTVLTESRHVATDAAGILVGVYFGAIGVGRVVCGAVAERVGLDGLIRGCMLVAMLGTVLFTFGLSLPLSAVGLISIGFGLAPIFPCLMAQTPRRLPPGFAEHAIGFQVAAAMLGAAIVPATAGFLAQWTGLEMIPRLAICVAMAMAAAHQLLIFYAGTRKHE
jgi:fucose permease